MGVRRRGLASVLRERNFGKAALSFPPFISGRALSAGPRADSVGRGGACVHTSSVRSGSASKAPETAVRVWGAGPALHGGPGQAPQDLRSLKARCGFWSRTREQGGRVGRGGRRAVGAHSVMSAVTCPTWRGPCPWFCLALDPVLPRDPGQPWLGSCTGSGAELGQHRVGWPVQGRAQGHSAREWKGLGGPRLACCGRGPGQAGPGACPQ